MKNYFTLEIKYALAIWTAMLLWLTFEMLAGLHSTRIELHPIVTMLALFIPIIGRSMLYRALVKRHNTKASQNNLLSVKDVFVSGMVMTALSTALAPLAQLIFHKLINPNFFANMIAYANSHGHPNSENYFNFESYMVKSTVGSMVFSFLLTLVFTGIHYIKNRSASGRPL